MGNPTRPQPLLCSNPSLDANQRAGYGVCEVVVGAGGVVDAILSASGGSTLKTTEPGDQTRMIPGLTSVPGEREHVTNSERDCHRRPERGTGA